MRIVHVSSGSIGGAGNAAKRLHSALLDSGVDSNFLTLNLSDSTIQKKTEIRRNLLERLLSFVSSRIHARISKLSFFSSWSISISRAMNTIRKFDKEATIIHIHNWYNILSLENISELVSSNYRLVFTLHDQRIFTGGCHFAFSCDGFKSHCNACPQMSSVQRFKPPSNLELQRKIFSNKENIRFIAPSNWIANEITSSGICDQSLVKKISNVNPELGFAFEGKVEERDLLTIGIASVHPYSYIKGGELVRELEKYLVSNNLKIRIEFLKNFSAAAHKDFWGCIDFLLVPSIVDNSPNVIHEAKMLGLPVIATRVGGIAEMLSEPFDQVIDENRWEFEKIIKDCTELLADIHFEDYKTVMMKRYAVYIGSPINQHIDFYKNFLAQKLID